MDATDMIDFSRHPIDEDGAARAALIGRVRADLARDGCAVVERFATAAGVAALAAEAESVAGKGHRTFGRTNPYFTADDPALPAEDPRRRFFDLSNAFIPADNLRRVGPLRKSTITPPSNPFIRDCLQEERFYRHADPLADVIVNMADEGPGFPWCIPVCVGGSQGRRRELRRGRAGARRGVGARQDAGVAARRSVDLPGAALAAPGRAN